MNLSSHPNEHPVVKVRNLPLSLSSPPFPRFYTVSGERVAPRACWAALPGEPTFFEYCSRSSPGVRNMCMERNHHLIALPDLVQRRLHVLVNGG